MSGHTPGPWRTEEQWHGTAIKADKRTVARTSPWSNREEQANARLIAAAPDLLAAVESLVADIEAYGEPEAALTESMQDCYAAIKAARGLEDA